MDGYFTVIRGIIEAHGGTVEKFIGDAVMAVFGIPVVHEDDALRAVRAADAIRIDLAALDGEPRSDARSLTFRTGINTGEVFARDPTGGQAFVTGDPVNTAARLEQAAGPGEILLGESTYQLVRDAVTIAPVAPIEAKGKTHPVIAYRLIGVGQDTAERTLGGDGPIIGREHELDALQTVFRDVTESRRPRLVTVHRIRRRRQEPTRRRVHRRDRGGRGRSVAAVARRTVKARHGTADS